MTHSFSIPLNQLKSLQDFIKSETYTVRFNRNPLVIHNTAIVSLEYDVSESGKINVFLNDIEPKQSPSPKQTFWAKIKSLWEF
jgi:hypothetical protein